MKSIRRDARTASPTWRNWLFRSWAEPWLRDCIEIPVERVAIIVRYRNRIDVDGAPIRISSCPAISISPVRLSPLQLHENTGWWSRNSQDSRAVVSCCASIAGSSENRSIRAVLSELKISLHDTVTALISRWVNSKLHFMNFTECLKLGWVLVYRS